MNHAWIEPRLFYLRLLQNLMSEISPFPYLSLVSVNSVKKCSFAVRNFWLWIWNVYQIQCRVTKIHTKWTSEEIIRKRLYSQIITVSNRYYSLPNSSRNFLLELWLSNFSSYALLLSFEKWNKAKMVINRRSSEKRARKYCKADEVAVNISFNYSNTGGRMQMANHSVQILRFLHCPGFFAVISGRNCISVFIEICSS